MEQNNYKAEEQQKNGPVFFYAITLIQISANENMNDLGCFIVSSTESVYMGWCWSRLYRAADVRQSQGPHNPHSPLRRLSKTAVRTLHHILQL